MPIQANDQILANPQRWIGHSIDDLLIDELIAEGTFSWVYRARSTEGSDLRAIKIAKSGSIGLTAPDAVPTKAFALLIGTVKEVTPDTSDLLARQVEILQEVSDPTLISVQNSSVSDQIAYCSMELLDGQTLRQLINSGPVKIDVFLELARGLQRVQQKEFAHGNLTPDNIMVVGGRPKILAPGYFGPLQCREGPVPICLVTTPSYYPALERDDLLALGLIIWEAALGQRPFGSRGDREMMDLSKIGHDLLELVRLSEGIGKFYLTPILAVRPPSEIMPGISSALQAFLLKVIRLKLLPDGTLERDPGFKSFSALAGAILALASGGTTHFGVRA